MHVVYACRSCPYDKGKGKRTFTLDHEGKGKPTLNLHGEDGRQLCGRGFVEAHEVDQMQAHIDGKGKCTLNLQGEEQDHVRATISWRYDEQDSRFRWLSVEPPPGLEDERVWPPPALVDAWIRKGKGLGKERGIDVWIGKGKDKGKGNAWNNEVLLRHVWDLVDAVIGKGNGKGKEEDMEQRKGKGYVWP